MNPNNTKKDRTRITIQDLLMSNTQGLTIKEMMDITKLARHTLLSRLHNLVGEGRVNVRQINMAKLHYWKQNVPTEKELLESMRNNDLIRLVPIRKEHIKIKPKKPQAMKVSDNKHHKPNINISDKGIAERLKNKSHKIENSDSIDIASIKAEIEGDLRKGLINKKGAQILKHRNVLTKIPIKGHKPGSHEGKEKGPGKHYIKTGIEGFDELLEQGIPQGNSIILAGGAGSGKTIFALQTLAHHAMEGEKCLYMTFEESEEDLIEHMEEFGWSAKELIKKGKLKIQRFNPFDITRNVDALLAQQKGELLIEIDPVIIPKNFKPDFIVLDSLTAIASAFTSKEESYRIYIEQLFRFFEKIGATSFLITETEQIPKIFSTTGVEEFLAGGVVVLYNLKHGNVRENALEILKLRGAAHQKKIVAYQITGQGLIVYPEQEVFSEI
jgi:KaiC/GvpD/RAD55 family RecA-like ATPase